VRPPLLMPALSTPTLLQTIWVFLSFLVAERQVRLALVWSFAILGCAGVVGLLKLLLTACGPRPTFAGMPSGHTAMSTAIYGSLSRVIARSSPPVVRAVVYCGGIVLISGIGASRLVLRYHARLK
jgi:membrane-associated phospholipid phosphatase